MARSFQATVADIRLYSRDNGQALWQISLDHSEFAVSPRNVARPAGTLTARNLSGAVLTLDVLEVAEDSFAELWHLTNKPLPVGTPVECEVF
jgi:hypothetical protein